jgi:hypothetical protein
VTQESLPRALLWTAHDATGMLIMLREHAGSSNLPTEIPCVFSIELSLKILEFRIFCFHKFHIRKTMDFIRTVSRQFRHLKRSHFTSFGWLQFDVFTSCFNGCRSVRKTLRTQSEQQAGTARWNRASCPEIVASGSSYKQRVRHSKALIMGIALWYTILPGTLWPWGSLSL